MSLLLSVLLLLRNNSDGYFQDNKISEKITFNAEQKKCPDFFPLAFIQFNGREEISEMSFKGKKKCFEKYS